MLFTGLGRSVLRENRLGVVLKTSGTVSPNTDLPAGEKHIYMLCNTHLRIKFK